jgi:uncharacterized protein YdeI (YjbR/CyaY-like superfamily)
LLTVDGVTIGFAIIKESLLHLIMIDTPFQRSGYGSKLLRHIENGLFMRHNHISLSSFKANTTANRFYLKNGWALAQDDEGQESDEMMLKFEKRRTDTAEYLQFASRDEFRSWLNANCESSGGVWLLFGKTSGPKTIKANDALEEALCFGWIDGQMQSIDDKAYVKYFSERVKNSKWSDKNKAIAEQLEKQGLMTDHGRTKIEEAKKNGQWSAAKSPIVTDEQIAFISDLLKNNEPAYMNYQAMSPSVKKIYARAYFDAKTDAGRAKRLLWMTERLNQNLKPM